MKAERRHELKENDLLHALQVGREYLEKNGTRVGIWVIIIVAVAAVAAFGWRSRTVTSEDLWRRKSQLSYENVEVGKQSLEALATMTRGVSDRHFVLSSLIDQGQQALRLAKDVPFPPDKELNEKARAACEQLLAEFHDNPLAFGIAHCSLATVEENAFVLDEDPAHKEQAEAHLKAVIDNPALNGMPFQRMAMDRRKALDDTFARVTFDYSTREETGGAPSPSPGAPIQIEPIRIEPAAVEPTEAEPVDDLDLDVVEPLEELPIDLLEDADEAEASDDAGVSPVEGSDPGSDDPETGDEEASQSQSPETP
jgi:hypothetical protein